MEEKIRYSSIKSLELERQKMLVEDPEDAVAIYQLKPELDESDCSLYFMAYKYLENKGAKPEKKNYDLVYYYKQDLSNVKNISLFLENVFEKFNIDRPTDYVGQSLSTSDVVVLKKAGEIRAFYVDFIGFEPIQW